MCDHGGFYHGEATAIREAVAASTGAPLEAILLTATHDHSAHAHYRDPDMAYVAFLAREISEAAGAALERLEPVRVGWTSVPAPGINRSRTAYLRDGRAYTERWLIPSTWHVKPEDLLRRGPADEMLRLLIVERLDRSRLAVMADFSCHNMAGMNDPNLHDDFFGVAMEAVETVEGGGCVALCTPGSEGDQNPMGLIRLGGDLVLEHVLGLGRRLAGYILAGSQGVEMHDVFALGVASERVEIAAREDWRARSDVSRHPELSESAATGRTVADVAAVAIGDYAMVGMPAELFTDPARRIREHAPFDQVSVIGLTNGKLMYVAESEAFFEESTIYGVEPDFPNMAQPGSDRILHDAALRALRRAKAAQRPA